MSAVKWLFPPFHLLLSGPDGETEGGKEEEEHPELKAIIAQAYRRRSEESDIFLSWKPLAFWIMTAKCLPDILRSIDCILI